MGTRWATEREQRNCRLGNILDRAVNYWSDDADTLITLNTDGFGFHVANYLQSRQAKLDSLFVNFAQSFEAVTTDTHKVLLRGLKRSFLESFLTVIYYMLIYHPDRVFSDRFFSMGDVKDVSYLLELTLWEITIALDSDPLLIEQYGNDALGSHVSPEMREEHDPKCLSDTDPELVEMMFSGLIEEYVALLFEVFDDEFRGRPQWEEHMRYVSATLIDQLGTCTINHNKAVGSCYLTVHPDSLNPISAIVS